MEATWKIFAPRWGHGEYEQDVVDAMAWLKRKAEQQDPSPVNASTLLGIARGMNSATGRGTDSLGPLDVRNLPPKGLEQLATLFNEIERNLAWPWQLLLVAQSLLPKPKGGDRGIGLLPWTCRLWSAAKDPLVKGWADSRAGFWDQAVAGSSALQCALVRCFMDETAGAVGAAFGSLFHDVQEFYDWVNVPLAIIKAVQLGYPSRVACLVFSSYLSTRLLTQESTVSAPIWPTRSLVAGCKSANNLARGFLYHSMEYCTWKHMFVKSTEWGRRCGPEDRGSEGARRPAPH